MCSVYNTVISTVIAARKFNIAAPLDKFDADAVGRLSIEKRYPRSASSLTRRRIRERDPSFAECRQLCIDIIDAVGNVM